MCRHSAAFRLLSFCRKQSAGNCASADKLGNGTGNGFGLLQQHKVSRARQVDNPDALAELLAERVTIARRSRFIIEPLDHEKGAVPAPHQSPSAIPRLVARWATCTAGQHSTCASIFGSDAGDSQRAPRTVTQSLPFILTSVALRKGVPWWPQFFSQITGSDVV